ncbi:hypothetical protein OC842_006928 [Tilletia horrida]|uniref:Uncharacterized protein n=1 Tax=Tilletia horrida TaxID=155126 RepID=A0AAN6JHG7_9BASI|nr:hypothetical protein OC842_006928 [Tilletia horrida]
MIASRTLLALASICAVVVALPTSREHPSVSASPRSIVNPAGKDSLHVAGTHSPDTQPDNASDPAHDILRQRQSTRLFAAGQQNRDVGETAQVTERATGFGFSPGHSTAYEPNGYGSIWGRGSSAAQVADLSPLGHQDASVSGADVAAVADNLVRVPVSSIPVPKGPPASTFGWGGNGYGSTWGRRRENGLAHEAGQA